VGFHWGRLAPALRFVITGIGSRSFGNSQPNYYRLPRFICERRKRWTPT
jgi:hypothetical protein